MSRSTPATDPRLRVSRRGFLKASGVGVAVAAGSIGAIPFSASRAAAQQGWDAEFDVVVAGSGNAAFAAAITAKANGDDVVMYEKGTYVGGTTLVSGGGGWFPNNPLMQADGFEDPREDAIKYMTRYALPHVYNPEDAQYGLSDDDYALYTRYYDTAAEVVALLQDEGAITWTYGRNFGPHFDQVQIDYMEEYEENIPKTHRTLHPSAEDGNPGGGGDMIGGYTAWAEANGIGINLNHRVDQVILNSAGEVIGVEVVVTDPAAAATPEANAAADASPVADSQTLAIRARKGVIFGTGGFSRNADMMRHLMPAPYYGGCAAPTNEGDLLRISAALGAKLGNLHNVWRNEGIFEQAVADTGAYNCSWFLSGDSFLIVNKTGRRFVNEKRNYQDRPMAHQDWDANYGDWTSRLGFVIYDQRVQDSWGGMLPLAGRSDHRAVHRSPATRSRSWPARSRSGSRACSASPATSSCTRTSPPTSWQKSKSSTSSPAPVDDLDFSRGSLQYDVTIPFGPMNPNRH